MDLMLVFKPKHFDFLIRLIGIILIPAVIFAQSGPDSTDRYRLQLNAYPYVYYTPETELAFGGGGVMTWYMQKDTLLNPSNITFSGFYSTVKTYELSVISGLFFDRNRMASTIDLKYSHKVDRFYGIGNNTPDLGTEEYTINIVGGIVDFQLPPAIIISDRSGLVIEYRDYRLDDRKENPYLQSDSITGSNGGVVSGLGMVYVWDTRDNVFFPNKGGFSQVKVLFYTKDLGSDFTFNWVEVNARRYWAFAQDQVLAVQFYLNTVGGDPPFYKLAALGGSKIMRGYFEGRYRDNDYFAMQIEYRQYFWWRFGYAVFAGFGDVVDQITRLSITNLKPSYGFGLRFLFNKEQKINLRADIGFGKHTNGIYFSIEEAF